MTCYQVRYMILSVVIGVVGSFGAGGIVALAVAAEGKQQPQVGEQAPDFELMALDGKTVKLASLLREGPVALLVLRGYPGYQCPICNRQVGQFLGQATKFTAAGARVVMVYPGPSKELQARAHEFIEGKTLPKHFTLVIDPDYVFTNAYHLRWEAERETAYPSTFVIGQDGKIRLAKVSRTHGDRASAEEVLRALGKE
jgi:thioredoxin-dependent peroxiredoxin